MNMKKIVPLMFVILMAAGGYCHAYDSIIGIPDPPSVLIDADVDMYVGQTYNFSLDGRGVLTYPISPVTGKPYTHYVDMDDPNADDTDNPYGTPEKPRETLPIQSTDSINSTVASLRFPAGSIIEIHGGPYTPAKSSAYFYGTSDAPCFFRGNGIDGELGDFEINFGGDYFVIEDLSFSATNVLFYRMASGYGLTNEGTDYAIVRNNTFTGNGTGFDAQAIKPYGLLSGTTDQDISNLVIYNNTCSYYGDPYQTTSDVDNCFCYLWGKTEYVWVINNYSHHNDGDSVQIGNGANRQTQHIYVGGNHFHNDRENPVDIKEAQHVVVSQNEFHGHNPGTIDYGGGLAIHTNDLGDEARDIWIIYNEIYDVAGIVFAIKFNCDDVYVIGNVIRDLVPKYVSSMYINSVVHTSYQTAAITQGYINNTIENCAGGFWFEPTNASAHIYVYNNIIDTLSNGADGQYEKHLLVEYEVDVVDFDYNILNQDGIVGNEVINWDGTDYSLAEYQSTFSKGLNCIADAPDFVNQSANNLYLQSGSPAEDAATSSGIVDTIFDLFETNYGLDIRNYDVAGNTRTGSWDMGAYEGEGSETKYLLFWTGN
jgi:hypothetical protein